ncbi:zinc finger protein 385D-like [Onthophagus taurus]|uniref:zinc finger protein 385D-like n=1 Tax=Onthophagus taurus TaxID=166361 RepID=UPI0039BDF6B5
MYVVKSQKLAEMSGELRNSIEEVHFDPNIPEHLDDPFQLQKKVYVCQLCNVQVTSSNVLKRHNEGRKHRMRVERQGKTFKCDLCDISANSQSQLDAHLKSSKHKAKLIRRENANQMMNKGIWIILFGVVVIFLNLLLLFKYINLIL